MCFAARTHRVGSLPNPQEVPDSISCHVHLNQPGRTEWEGFETGSRSAVSGGITTLIDMPLNSIPPTTTVENLRVKQAEALRVGTYSDIGFWGGIIPGNASDLVPLLQAGVKGFKCFLINSGVDVSEGSLYSLSDPT
jgi:allantoinase